MRCIKFLAASVPS